jgi:hypothetical protein
MFLLFGLYYTAESFGLSREGQLTDRYTKALELLKGEGDSPAGGRQGVTQSGAVYALERIAQDSERDHWPIIELLTAHVRAVSPRSLANVAPDGGLPKLRDDVEAVIAAIVRRTSGRETSDQRVVLEESYLYRANFNRAHLARVYLVESYLEGAAFCGADLSGADLNASELNGADFREAELAGAIFDYSNVEGADFRNARNIDLAQIRKARNWREALYSENVLQQLQLPSDNNKRVVAEFAREKDPGRAGTCR